MASDSHPFRVLAALMVAALLVPTGALGLLGALTDPGPMRPVWALMGVGGLVGAGGALHTVWQARRAGQREAVRLQAAPNPRTPDEALARWTIEPGVAQRFSDAEWARRRVEVLGGGLGLAVLGTGLVWWGEDAERWAAFATGGFVGGLYLLIGLGKYKLEHEQARRGAGVVLVYEDAVYVLGSWHALGGDRWLAGVEVAEDALELKVRWQTSKGGPAEDVVRVPFPAGEREQVEALAAMLGERVR